MAELIEMTFGLKIWADPRNHGLDGSSYHPCKGAARCKVLQTTAVSCAKMATVQIAPCEDAIFRGKNIPGNA